MLQKSFSGHLLEAGCDEAGRGCLAGPVVAAAVILPDNFSCAGINDSKKLTHHQRQELEPLIKANAIAFAIGIASHHEIDKINILNASILAMHRAIEKLNKVPELLIIDGNRFKPYEQIPFKTLIKGDAHFLSIAAASILAKVERDRIMAKLHKKFPVYHWNQNKGYPTAVHRAAIEIHGASPLHRHSFTLLKVD